MKREIPLHRKNRLSTSMVTVHFSMKQIFLLTSSFVFSPSAFRMMKQSISAGWNLGSDTVNCSSCRIWPLPLSFKIFCQVPMTKIYHSYLFEFLLIKSFIDISYLTNLKYVGRKKKNKNNKHTGIIKKKIVFILSNQKHFILLNGDLRDHEIRTGYLPHQMCSWWYLMLRRSRTFSRWMGGWAWVSFWTSHFMIIPLMLAVKAYLQIKPPNTWNRL